MVIILFWFFPSEGIKIANMEFHFISKEEFLNENELMEFKSEIPNVDINYDSINKAKQHIQDSLKNELVLLEKKHQEAILLSKKNIQYPNNDPSILFSFFKKLENAKFKKVRIMHYGDSQIECDRISGRLRQRLQKKFGGKGAGIFPIIAATKKSSLNNIPSKNWIRKTGFGSYIDKEIKHKKYGALFSYCTMNRDSLFKDTNFIYNGEITIKRPTKSYQLCRSFNTLKIFYSNSESTILRLLINDSIFLTDTLKKSDEIKVKQLYFSKGPREFKLQFSSNISPKIYGISLEGKKGVVVDNIPLRGASGTEFSKVDLASLRQMQKLISADLFILEFGGNTIPYIKSKERAIKYGNYFKKQILKLKKINPKAMFLIIGPADMAKKQKTEFITYPILEDVISALKTAAFETNSCFWDMYLNMGGENSIQKWVSEKPALAARDYIHFTHTGAKKIADFFIEDFMKAYDNYLDQKND